MISLVQPGGNAKLQATGEYNDARGRDEFFLTFGKHKGRHIDQVGDAYLQWILKNFPHSSPWQKAAADTLASRDKTRLEGKNAPDLLSELKTCGMRRDLQWGRRIHARAVSSRSDTNKYVLTALIMMYAKCGSMVDARGVFDSILKPDVVSWNALILGYAENGHANVALDLFHRMKACRTEPNSVTYVAALKVYTSLAVNGDGSKQGYLERGRAIHSAIGCHMNRYVQNTLINLYSKCGSMLDAHRVFDSIHMPDVVSWNALLMGYAENGEGQVALGLFSKMKAGACAPDSVTYVSALKACTSLAVNGNMECLERGREIHLEIGCHSNLYVWATLIDMYAKCGSMVDARRVFDSIQSPDVVSWNALLLGYAENGEGQVALDLFSTVKSPNSVTYVAALKACASLAASEDGSRKDYLERGREIHSEIGSRSNHLVQTTLVDMYAKCGSMVEARRVFDSIRAPGVVSWNALLLGYAEQGDGHVVLDLFSRMKAGGCLPDSVTYIAALKGCGSTGSLALGRRLHSEIRDITSRVVTCLIDFYAKCGSMVEAREVFDSHPRARDVSTWTALLAGYGSLGDSVSVFNLFEVMQDKGFRPDGVTFVCLLLCCSHAGLVEKAREYFDAMPVKYGITPTVKHYNCMVDILGRANQLNEAIALLRRMPCKPDAVTWTALLDACCKWKNVEIGRLAFQSLVDIDKTDASAYVLMASIYGSKGMWEEQERVLETRAKIGWTSKVQ